MTITLLELRNQCRQRADMENSDFITEAELTAYVNSSIAELHDLLISAYDSDYYISSTTFNTTAGTDSYALPANFYKLRGVDITINSTIQNLQPFNFNERNVNQGLGWAIPGAAIPRYRIVGGNLVFAPVPDSTTPVKLWYIPVATKLVNDSDTLADLNQFAEYVIIDAAIKMKVKEESDISELAALKQAMGQRIVAMAQNRDSGQGDSVSDVHAVNNIWLYGVK